jgi:DNA primase large subunit
MMIPISQLQFARKYPFTQQAKQAVKQLSPSMEELDPNSFETALQLVRASAIRNQRQRRSFVEQHFSRKDLSYEEFLANDVLAFPLSKIFISYIANDSLYDRFSSLIADLTFEYLVNEKDRLRAFLDLVNDLKLNVTVKTEDDQSIILIPLTEYLSIPVRDAQLHLVNQSVESGLVLVDLNASFRWLAEVVHHTIRTSLPVPLKGLPEIVEKYSAKALEVFQQAQKQEFKHSVFGNVRVDSFPPCMEKMYSELNSGINLPHMARFDLATFLINISMHNDSIINLFSKAPNFNEQTTRYHVENLSGKKSGKKYSAPSCSKLREHGLCISRTCNVHHPLQFYRREKEQVFSQSKRTSVEQTPKEPAE